MERNRCGYKVEIDFSLEKERKSSITASQSLIVTGLIAEVRCALSEACPLFGYLPTYRAKVITGSEGSEDDQRSFVANQCQDFLRARCPYYLGFIPH